MSTVDYSKFGMTIRSAMVADAKRFPRRTPSENYILWGNKEIRTSYLLKTPWTSGHIKLTFLKDVAPVRQGVDISVEDGLLLSDEGLKFETLRTWCSSEYEDAVEYKFESLASSIFVWNVYTMDRGNGVLSEEKWTGNAGFWVEQRAELSYLFHCSYGSAAEPDFESLVFQIELSPTGKF